MTKPLAPELEREFTTYRRWIEFTMYMIVLAPLPVVWFYWPEFDKRALAVRQTRTNNPNATLRMDSEMNAPRRYTAPATDDAPTLKTYQKTPAFSQEDE